MTSQHKEVHTGEFEEVALPHLLLVYRVAFRLVGHRADAEDLVQETFLKALRGFHHFQVGTNCRAWLLSILRHAHLDQLRRTARQPPTESWEEIEFTHDGSHRSAEAFEAALEESLDEEVELALQSLPPQQRLAVILADLEGMSYEEIARALDCPIGTVRSRLHYARAALRQRLWQFAKERGYATS